jgi:hypothetical protein
VVFHEEYGRKDKLVTIYFQLFFGIGCLCLSVSRWAAGWYNNNKIGKGVLHNVVHKITNGFLEILLNLRNNWNNKM